MQILKVLVVIISFCIETNNLYNIQRNVGTTMRRVDSLFRTCSNNRTGVEYVLHPQIIRLPCSMRFMTCRYDVVDQTVSPMLKTSDYFSVIYILPSNLACPFAGLAYVGCKTNCRVWVNEDYYDKSNVYMHELGHNLGLQHAHYKGIEYSDITDTMGFCCIERCFNPINSHKLGWTTPRKVFNTRMVTVNRNEYVLARQNNRTFYVQFTGSSPLIPRTFQNQIALYEATSGGRTNLIESYSIQRNTSVVRVANNVATFNIPIR